MTLSWRFDVPRATAASYLPPPPHILHVAISQPTCTLLAGRCRPLSFMRWLPRQVPLAIRSLHRPTLSSSSLRTGLRLPAICPPPSRYHRRDFHATGRNQFIFGFLKRILSAIIMPGTQVANKELDFLHQVLGLTSQANLPANLKDAVFICIDCEAFEFDQKKVTELGVAVLDTEEIAGTEPGPNGENWIAKMKYAHYRPVEYARYVNRKFVKGCEDGFAFGDTVWIRLPDATRVLGRIFRSPQKLHEAANFAIEPSAPGHDIRNVIFVAHGLANDDKYLAQLGFDLRSAHNIVRQVDSQHVAGATKKNNIGLKRLLLKLGIQHQGLHNAANDAAYTLQAVILMAVKEHKQPGLIFGEQDLPAMVLPLPGTVRAEGQQAKHVFGGTAKESKVKLPLDGGKPKRDKLKGKPKGGESKAAAGVSGEVKKGTKRGAPTDGDDAGDSAKKKKKRMG